MIARRHSASIAEDSGNPRRALRDQRPIEPFPSEESVWSFVARCDTQPPNPDAPSESPRLSVAVSSRLENPQSARGETVSGDHPRGEMGPPSVGPHRL